MQSLFDYQPRFVGFVDILGFSSLIRDKTRSEQYARSLFNLLSLIIDPDSGFQVGEHIDTGEEIEFAFWSPVSDGGQLTTMSDAIVLSYPEYSEKTEAADGPSVISSSCPEKNEFELLDVLQVLIGMFFKL